MSKPKLVTLVEGLEPLELVSLKKYTSTKTGIDSETFALFEYILKNRHNGEMIENVDAFIKNLFPNSSQKTISNYLSTLFSWAEEWVLIQQLEIEKYTSDLLVLKWLNKRGFYHLADQIARKIEKNIENDPTIDIENNKAKAQLLANQLISNNPYKYETKNERFTEMVRAYNEGVKAQNLIFKTELINWGGIINHDYTALIEFIDRLNDHIPDTPLTVILEAMYRLVSNSDVEAFKLLKENLFNNTFDKQSEFHYIIATYCIQRSTRFWTKGIITEPRLIVEMYEYGLNSGVLLSSGKIQSATFHNIIMQLTQVNTFEAVELFIDKWLPKVSTENIEATRALAMAQNCFYFDKYKEIFQYTWRSDFATFNQKNTAQGLYLIATFMFRNEDPLLFHNALKSSLYFIKRNKSKMSQHLFDSYNNLFDFMVRYDKGLIKERQLTYSPIMYKIWCEKMLKENQD